MRYYISPAVFAFAALLFEPHAQAQYEMPRNMTAAELEKIHREVEQLYGENPGLPVDGSGDTEQERIDSAEPQPTLPAAAAAAIPEIKKRIQKIHRPPPQKPAVNKSTTPQNTGYDRRSPPAYQHKGSKRIR